MIERGTVLSKDGTSLSYMRIGSGDPLLVCHGSFSNADEWLAFAEHLSASRTVYLYDRRGRGRSPATVADPTVDAEVDDLAVMAVLAGPHAAVLGHSFGGGCALSFALRERFAGELLLYEPRHALRGLVSRGHVPEIERMVARGEREAAVEFVLRHVVGLPKDGVLQFRQSDQWGRMCAHVDAFGREVLLLDTLAWRSGELDAMPCTPVLLLGEQSRVLPDALSPDVALRSLLPNMTTTMIPGAGHFAYISAPAILADTVARCLSACARLSSSTEREAQGVAPQIIDRTAAMRPRRARDANAR